jgi:MFS family permease
VDSRVATIQRRTLRLLFGTQIIGGVGVAIGISVGALLAADMGGAGVSGLASSAAVIGGALLAVPATRLMRRGGRRPGLVFAYLTGAVGSLVIVVGAATGQVLPVFAGMLLFGGGTAANLQARYTAVDLAEPARRGRQLSLIVWATTVGAVAGPNLAPLADRAVRGWGLREYSGPFAFSALAFGLAGGAVLVLLRPDPLLVVRAIVARTAAADADPAPGAAAPGPDGVTPAGVGGVASAGVEGAAGTGGGSSAGGLRLGWQAVTASPAARLGVSAVAVGHVVMIGVMSMTPVHINEGGHDHAAVLRIVGLVLSLHIAGMFALAPLMGWLTDRLGRRPVILLGIGLLLLACAVAGTAGHDTARLSTGLLLLGLGWSATMVAGSTLLSESVAVDVRPVAQGLADMVMGMAGAAAGALAGVVVAIGGYPTLTLLAAIATLPLLALSLRPAVAAPAPG